MMTSISLNQIGAGIITLAMTPPIRKSRPSMSVIVFREVAAMNIALRTPTKVPAASREKRHNKIDEAPNDG